MFFAIRRMPDQALPFSTTHVLYLLLLLFFFFHFTDHDEYCCRMVKQGLVFTLFYIYNTNHKAIH